MSRWTEKQTGIVTIWPMQGAVSKQAAAGLAPGRPDEGVWAYVCIAKLRSKPRSSLDYKLPDYKIIKFPNYYFPITQCVYSI
jgi:hypothetical protein